MLTGANATHGLHLPPILDRSKAHIRAYYVDDEGPSSERRYSHSNRDHRISRSLNINTTSGNSSSSSSSCDNNKWSLSSNSETTANIRQNSADDCSRASDSVYRSTTDLEVAVPCDQTPATANRNGLGQISYNGIPRRPLLLKRPSGLLQSTKPRPLCSDQVPPIVVVNRSRRTIDGRSAEGQTTTAEGATYRQLLLLLSTDLTPVRHPSAPPPPPPPPPPPLPFSSQTHQLLLSLTGAGKPENPALHHSLNSREDGSGGMTIASVDHDSPLQSPPGGRCRLINKKAALRRIEPRLRPFEGDSDSGDPLALLLRESRALEDPPTKHKATTAAVKRGGGGRGEGGKGGADRDRRHLNDRRHHNQKQLSDGAILPPRGLTGQWLHRSTGSTIDGSSVRDRANNSDDGSMPDQRESQSPTDFIRELTRLHKEATDRCLLGPSKEERDRHRAKYEATSGEAADAQMGEKMTDKASKVQYCGHGIDENPDSRIMDTESSGSSNLVECKTEQKVEHVDGGGPAMETDQQLDITETGPKDQSAATTVLQGKQFNPLENYGFEWQSWAKLKKDSEPQHDQHLQATSKDGHQQTSTSTECFGCTALRG